jgi:cell shape-determining protein MreC
VFSRLSRRRVLALVVLSSVLLLTLDRNGNPFVNRARTLVDRISQPFESAAEAVARPVANAWGAVSEYDELEAENARLRSELESLRGKEVLWESSILLAQDLLDDADLADQFAVEPVRVSGQAPSNLDNTVEINKGSNFGIAVGMPVTSQGGIVGRVTSVTATNAVVLLVVDPQYFIGVEVLTVDGPQPELPDETENTAVSGDIPGGTSSTSSPTTTTTTVPADSTDNAAIPVDPEVVTTSSSTSSTSSTTSTTTPLIRRETGVLTGAGPDKPLVVEFIDAEVRIGDVVTSAGGSSFGGSVAPQGLPIGRVVGVRVKPGTRSILVDVEPSADLDSLSFLNVVLFAPNAQQ